MCEICVKVGPDLDVNEKSELLRQIGEKIENCGECADHFTAAIDVLLGMGLEDRDPYVEASWEQDYRNRDEN